MSWPMVALGEVAEIVSGATPKTSTAEYWDGGIAWATPKDLSGLNGKYLAETPRNLTEAGLKSCAARLLPEGSVLFSSRAPIGHVAINTKPMATNQGFKSMIPGPTLSADFLYWWLRANRSAIERLGSGATFKEVSKAVVSRIEIPLPPLDEQKRIAAILDKADALRRARVESSRKLARLSRAAFGKLFGDYTVMPSAYPVVPFGELVDDALIGLVRGAKELSDEHPTPYMRMDAIQSDGRLELSQMRCAQTTQAERTRYELRPGDFLFNTRNSRELVGKTAVLREPFNGVYNNNILRVRFEPRVLADYVDAYLRTPAGGRELNARKSGTTSVFAVYQKALFDLPVPVPALGPQQAFSDFCERLFSVRSTMARAEALSDDLFASLQYRAFAGEL